MKAGRQAGSEVFLGYTLGHPMTLKDALENHSKNLKGHPIGFTGVAEVLSIF
jgi:hypothetical protein